VNGPYRSAAVAYFEAGWPGPLPLPANAKRDPPKGFTGLDGDWPSRPDIQAWLDNGASNGNICLRLPKTVIGIDVDMYDGKAGRATLTEMEAKWGQLPDTWMSSSRQDGSGIRFYGVPEGAHWPSVPGPGIEIIQYGHRYAVVSPSIHPNGGQYRWMSVDGVLFDSIPTLAALTPLPLSWVQGLSTLQPSESGTGWTDPDLDALVEHGIPEGVNQDEALRDVVWKLRRMGLARSASLRVWRSIVERTALTRPTEPWKKADFDRHWKGADAKLPPPLSEFVAPDGARPEAPPSQTDIELAKEIARQRRTRYARKLLDDEKAAAEFREPPSRFTLAEELALPEEPITYLVDQVFPTGSNVLLTSQFKTGKTTLVNHFTRCLADGEPFLGKHPVSQLAGRVALFNYEVDERQYRIWLRSVGIVNADAVSVLNLRGYRLPVLVQSVEDWIVAWLESRGVQVWIVDPFARAFVGSGVSENDNTQVGAFLDGLDVIKARAGVSELVLPTHTGRAEMDEGTERARGATRLDDWADVRWMLTSDDHGVRYFSATGRDVEVDETALTFDERTRRLSALSGNRGQVRKDRLEQAVLSVIEMNPGIGLAQLRMAVREIVRKAAQDAIADTILRLELNHLIRVDKGGAGKASAHWRTGPKDLEDEDK
jgi:AAA domain/Bifunctional DNA primase/polymerase, N-terminal